MKMNMNMGVNMDMDMRVDMVSAAIPAPQSRDMPCEEPSSVPPSMRLSPAHNAPQPYGIIPPRRKHSPARGRARSSSSLPPSLELLPTLNSHNTSNSTSMEHESLFQSLQNLMFSDTPLSCRPGFWASLKAQYLATAHHHLPSWVSSNSKGDSNKTSGSCSRKAMSRRSTTSCHGRDFAPPIALMVSNSSPVVTLDARPLVTSSSNLTDDALLSLPNIHATTSNDSSTTTTTTSNEGIFSGSYPVSVAAMDKFKVMRSDIIPLKTFTYRETLVVEAKRPSRPAAPIATTTTTKTTVSAKESQTTPPLVKRSMPKLPAGCRSGHSNVVSTVTSVVDELPLPRHLAGRETRSNTDYLRMMACELGMIRSRKLIAPLRPRGYLPRRKDVFHHVKSSMSVSMSMETSSEEEDYHPLFVGSWSSVLSADSFLSVSSSGYATADDEGFE
ncbi:hypothetical protein BC939DRAFT_474541 [Gamsiella multidivaricata]|uniref:uncharacterized protein n=1 Tax=Gamsiella multidivaricata TaxID=101098 RepID=UPI002220B554|nr:uncharacterized protein BC939DRAFT_474541 [Gamsiella multidivaricata]KAI7829026.1 hypothetical protein BC939DRAFT_474541 [Gamsiella multidivaricata]